ncbi:MAG TPA: alpha/beta hydrolase [Propionibacterium sp.]|nr:alpha/beta hydrolase [Propionibacterium sp.]
MFREFDAANGLHAGLWEPEGATATILAIHGITSSHRAWAPLARHLPDVRVIAPDLRGRGGSRGLGGPYGMARHADDVAALLDELGVDRCVAVGHSMGGYVAVTLAHRHPGRVSRLVLVDGGLPLRGDPSLDPEESLRRTLGPAAERLSRTFASPEEYRDFWRAHPSFADWTPDIESYVDYDLVRGESGLHPATSYEAMAADSRDLVTPRNDAVLALRDLTVDATFLRAERGMVDEPGGLFPADWVDEQVARQPRVGVVEVPDVNHYTITLSDPGAAAVADAVREALATAARTAPAREG